jgi:hypothetical protein
MIDRHRGRGISASNAALEPMAHRRRREGEEHTMQTIITDIDERWMAEWVTFGLLEFERYLDKYQCFEDYYSRRGRTGDRGVPALDG